MRSDSLLARRALAAALVAAASAPGCMVIGVDDYEESRTTIEVESSPPALTGGAQWSRLDERRASLAFDATTTTKRVVEDVVERAGELAVDDDTWFNDEYDDLDEGTGCHCLFLLVALPAIVLTPLVTGIAALAQLPFAGGETRENRRDEGVVVHHWLDEAVLRDGAGHSLALGVSGREQATFALELEDLARAGMTAPPWRLTAGDLSNGAELSFPVEVDAVSLQTLKRIEAEASAREEAATLHVAAGEDLGAALQRARPGAVIRLAAGEWILDRGFEFRAGVTIVGAGPDRTRLRSRDGGWLLSWRPADGLERLDLRGLCFDGGEAACVQGLVALFGTAVVTDCRFTGARPAPAESLPKDGAVVLNGLNLYVEYASATFRRCRFESKDGGNVIVAQGADGDCRFDACVFDGGTSGLAIVGHGPSAVTSVAHCEFVRQSNKSFVIAEQASARLDQCVFSGAVASIYARDQAELEVAGCRIEEASSCGVWTSESAKTAVRDSWFWQTPVAILEGPVAAVQANNRFVDVEREVAAEAK